MSTLQEAESFFDGVPVGIAALHWVDAVVASCGGATIQVSKSQVAFRRPHPSTGGSRTVALLWRPGQYLTRPRAPVVLSIPLDAPHPSPRWKQIAHPTRRTWMHHLEVTDAASLDEQVETWVREAYRR